MTTEQNKLADKIEQVPVGPFAILLGLNDGTHFKDVVAARGQIVAALRAAGEPVACAQCGANLSIGRCWEIDEGVYFCNVCLPDEPAPSAIVREALPEIPDDDADFTPDLARKIIAKYQSFIAALSSTPSPLMAAGEAAEPKNLPDNWDYMKDTNSVRCGGCLFRFGAEHPDSDGKWACPNCGDGNGEKAVAPQASAESTGPGPLDFFSQNVDAWGAAEWFDRLAKAVRGRNAAVVAKEDIQFEICNNVASSSASRLVMDFEAQVRTALRTPPQPSRIDAAAPASEMAPCSVCNGRKEIGFFDKGDDAWRSEPCPECCVASAPAARASETVEAESPAKRDYAARAMGEPTRDQINAAAEVIWNDRDARHGGSWSSVDPNLIAAHQTIATARAALIAAANVTAAVEPTREETIEAIRKYCRSISSAAIQRSQGEDRIYYAGLSVVGLADAILALKPRGEPAREGGE